MFEQYTLLDWIKVLFSGVVGAALTWMFIVFMAVL